MSQNKQKKDENIEGSQLPGWPGYRTRSSRSGLDPLDTRSEAAHMEGVFLRNIFTLRARTRNPLLLIMMFVFGVVPFTLLLALLFLDFPQLDLYLIIFGTLLVLITGAITVNFLLSILEILKIIPYQKRPEFSRAKIKKKKLPKRRKDFK
jgi:hypothetical protein